MVKLFVGNLADTVDSTKLKQVFQQFTKVTECDVVKNYAFVAICRYRDIVPFFRSTSKLRSQPGMSNQCFRCASTDHKTPNCPKDPNNQLVSVLNLRSKNVSGVRVCGCSTFYSPLLAPCCTVIFFEHVVVQNLVITQTIKIDLTGAVKRAAGAIDGPDAKRSVQMISMVDEEIPRPPQPELQQLYEEYNLSRQRYSYYRERLQKEIHAKRNGSVSGGSVYVTPLAPTISATSTQYCLLQLCYNFRYK
uniref:RRM domain-containing protein n=1 Tax=Angiostrongylus cantonensis TaxID=6313 RepID=A0A0K0DHB7_ANGCA